MNLQPNATGPLTDLVAGPDHLELSRLVTESAWRVDLGRADTVHELFVHDGELSLGRTYRGTEEIRAWGQEVEDTKPYPGIRHLATNMRFVASGNDTEGRDTAEGTTVLAVFLNDVDGRATSTPWVVGEDHDRFVRTIDGWRFTHRAWVQLFARE